MRCPYCHKYNVKEVNRDEEFSMFDSSIDIVLQCPDCGKESVLRLEQDGYYTVDGESLD